MTSDGTCGVSAGARAWRFIVPALLLLGAAVCPAGCAPRPEAAREAAEPQQESLGLSPGEAARLIQFHNRALGHLGTEDFAAAVNLLEELQATLPDEPAVAANLTVACLLHLKWLDFGGQRGTAEHQAAIQQADQAVRRLLQVAGDEADSHLLASKVARLAVAEQRSWQELERAAELAPEDPIVWFERFQTARGSADEQIRSQGAAALTRTHELVPDNLFVLVQLLWQQASDQNPAIADSLAAIRRLVEPLAGESSRIRNQNVLGMLDQATATFVDTASDEQQKWRTLQAVTRRMGNVLLAETPTRIDFRRIDRQDDRELAERALVRPELSAAFYASVPGLVKDLGPPISVKLAPAADSLQLPPLPAIRDLELLDFDLDGRLDVIALGERSVDVYGRPRNDAPWKLVAAFRAPGELRGMAAADLDRDVPRFGTSACTPCPCQADADLIVFGSDGLLVLENCLDEATGTRSLQDVGQDQGLNRLRDVSAVGLADVDHDGDLDLVVSAGGGVSVWSNGGQFSFQNISGRSELPAADLSLTAIVPVDWNHDADIDLLLAGDAPGAAGWLENRRHGRFAWHPFSAESGLDARAAVLELLDGNGDRSWDLLAAGRGGLILAQTTTSRDRRVQLGPWHALSEAPLAGLATWDYDNDGYLDVLAWGEKGLTSWRGTPDGQYHAEPALILNPPGRMRDCAVGDVDGDGDWDLFAATPDGVVWFVNEGGNRNRWIDVVPQPDANPEQFPDLRINMHAVGSWVELRAGPVCQSRLVSRLPVHFGLGQAALADMVQVHWTNGLTCTRLEPPAGQLLRVEQVLKGM